jgi:hypothetical protein
VSLVRVPSHSYRCRVPKYSTTNRRLLEDEGHPLERKIVAGENFRRDMSEYDNFQPTRYP